MPWPPQVGELLPRCAEPEGIEEKLRKYSLVPSHEVGGPKANGFLRMLGIDLDSIGYLEREIIRGIGSTPLSQVTPGKSDGFRCTVNFPLALTRALQSPQGLVAYRMDGGHARCTALHDDCLPERGVEMSVQRTEIGEHDVVALLTPVNGWPVGTQGAVVHDRPTTKFIEICNHRGEGIDYLEVPIDELRLTWKCPPPSASLDQGRR